MAATKVDGQVHNHPRFVSVDARNRAWFSDRHDQIPSVGPRRFPLLEHQSVLRLSELAGSWRLDRMTFDTVAPAGVTLSRDGATLYVADSPEDGEHGSELRAYAVNDNGSLGQHVVLHRFGPREVSIQGICTDEADRIVACAGSSHEGAVPGIYVFSPMGSLLNVHQLPVDSPLNCAFAGSSLYVSTQNGHLFRAVNLC